MPLKARKRGREDTSSGESVSEDAKRSLVVANSLSDYESASEQDDGVIQDTTVDVRIDPDAALSTTPTTLPPVQTIEGAPASSPLLFSDVEDSGTFKPPSTLLSSDVEDSGVAKTSPLFLRTGASDSSDHIEEFTPTPPSVRRITAEPLDKASDVIESPFPSGDSAVAAESQQHTASFDIASPRILVNPLFPFPAIDGVASALGSTKKGEDQSTDVTEVVEESDTPGPEGWQDDGCSSQKSSPHSVTHVSESILPTSGSGSDEALLPGEQVLRRAIEALLAQHLESSEALSD